MNIIIIGPEGAGKTVFVTMLDNYLINHKKLGLVFRAQDIYTKQYVANELRRLQTGDWPASTPGGRIISLNWKLLYKNEISYVSLIDPSGQDIRNELCGKTTNLQILQAMGLEHLL